MTMFASLTSVLCLVALTVAQAPAPKATTSGKSAASLGPLQAVLPEAVCSPSCKTICAAQKIFCVDLPGLVDCNEFNKQCVSLCDESCDCFVKCRDSCDESTKCDPKDIFSITGGLCQFQLKACVATCQSTCPVQIQFTVLQAGVETTMKQFQKFFAVFQPKKQ